MVSTFPIVWNAREITPQKFLARAEQEGIASFKLDVHRGRGEPGEDIFLLSFLVDAVGYTADHQEILDREGEFLRRVSYTDWTCRTTVPLLSVPPYRALFQEIGLQADDYAALCDVILAIELPWQESFELAVRKGESAERIYARLEEMEETEYKELRRP